MFYMLSPRLDMKLKSVWHATGSCYPTRLVIFCSSLSLVLTLLPVFRETVIACLCVSYLLLCFPIFLLYVCKLEKHCPGFYLEVQSIV